ncbi:MAG: DUF4873 domain-containing protein [Pseudonocardia sp.]
MDDDDYAGPATLLVNGRDLPVRVRLIAVHQPVDGRIHWAGRVGADPTLTELLGSSGADVELVTPEGRASGRIGEPDPWGRYRVTGVGCAPFRASVDVASVDVASVDVASVDVAD